jgi:hypothetical protein
VRVVILFYCCAVVVLACCAVVVLAVLPLSCCAVVVLAVLPLSCCAVVGLASVLSLHFIISCFASDPERIGVHACLNSLCALMQRGSSTYVRVVHAGEECVCTYASDSVMSV